MTREEELYEDIKMLRTELAEAKARIAELENINSYNLQIVREATARVEHTETERDAVREALTGLLEEWDRLTRYGSPMAKAANPRVTKARAALKGGSDGSN